MRLTREEIVRLNQLANESRQGHERVFSMATDDAIALANMALASLSVPATQQEWREFIIQAVLEGMRHGYENRRLGSAVIAIYSEAADIVDQRLLDNPPQPLPQPQRSEG